MLQDYGENRCCMVSVTLTVQEKKHLESLCRRAQMTKSNFMRLLLNRIEVLPELHPVPAERKENG